MRLRKIDPARIPALIASGLSAAEIAGEFGCTEGSLRVRCSQLKVSLRRALAQGERHDTAISRISASIAVQAPVTRTGALRPKRPRKIDPTRIPPLLDRGLSSAEIAAEFGCTLGALRMRCSRLQISLRRRRKACDQSVQPEPGRRPPADMTSPKGATLSRVAASDRSAMIPGDGFLDVALPAGTIDQLQRHAAAMGVSAAALAASLLETISRDCLYSAVLDAD
jgi:hypothetical protein